MMVSQVSEVSGFPSCSTRTRARTGRRGLRYLLRSPYLGFQGKYRSGTRCWITDFTDFTYQRVHMTIRTQHTKADVRRALQVFKRLAHPTERERAEDRMRRAKAGLTAAAQAVLDRHPQAAELGDHAIAKLLAARAELERLDSQAHEATCESQRRSSETR